MHRHLSLMTACRGTRVRNEGGYALLEVMIATLLTGILVAGLAGWSMTSMATVSQIRGWGIDESAADGVNRALTSDAATALVIVSPTTGSPMTDCPGGSGSGGSTKIVMVTATKQRIVYSLAPDSSSVTSRGQTLFRRVCPNNAVTGSSDFTQTDPLLTTTTSGSTSADSLANGVESAAAVCTASDGLALDPNCQTVRLTIDSANSSQANILAVATRRSDSYCRPGCKPEARFTFAPTDVQRNVQVSFDPSTSRDLRGGALVEWQWDFDRGGPTTNGLPCGSGIGGGPAQETRTAPTVLTRTFTTVLATCPAYQAGLRVKNADGVWSDWYEVAVAPRLRRPRAQITAPAPPPINVVENKPVTFQGTLTSYEEPLDDAGSSWDFGDGSAPVAACSSCGNSASSSVSHTFTTVGQYQVKLVATDQLGLTSTAFATVNVRSGKVFVRTGGSTDAASCGALSNPCAKIADAVNRAYTQTPRLTDVLVAGIGPYEGFSMREGISVTGGYDNDFQVPSIAIATEINKQAGTGDPVGVSAAGLLPTTPVTKLKNLKIDVTGSATQSTTGIAISSSSGLAIEGVTVVRATGLNATGLLATGSILTISNSNIASGAAQGAGSSAYGIRAIGGSNVTVTNGILSASPGIAGPNGSTPTGALTAGGVGGNGGSGSRAAVGGQPAIPPGGAAGSGANAGGIGGDGDNAGGNSGATGAIVGVNGGVGGVGGCNNCVSTSNYSGAKGLGGVAGTNGVIGSSGAAGVPAFSAAGFAPTAAANGNAGANGGGGGGGGGGGRACDTGACAGRRTSGGAGGGGGGGGQGGAGGAAGVNAGGSFAVYSHNSTVAIDANTTIAAGNGGAGGAGATGQAGALGGNGGVGGSGERADGTTGTAGSSGAAGGVAPNGANGGDGGNGAAGTCCNAGSGGGGGGGKGGDGGNGGTGGGGAGGPSVGLMNVGTGSITFGGNTATQITIGAGGGGGAAPGGNAGPAGIAAKTATA